MNEVQNKVPMSEGDRLKIWAERLTQDGYSSEATDTIIEIANRTNGLELAGNGKARPYGGQLVSMFGRLARRLKDESSVFACGDMEYAVAEILRYLQEKPLGDNVAAWRGMSNLDQKIAINEFFNLPRDPRESSSNKECLCYVRDSAWPSKKEFNCGIGGCYAERFFIFARTLARLCTVNDDSTDAIFNPFYHEFREILPEWIENGKCKECGGEVVKDSVGNHICSNPLCDHNVAAAASQEKKTPAPKTFRQPQKNERPNKKDRRDEENERAFSKKNKKFKKPRYEADSDGESVLVDSHVPTELNESKTVITSGGDSSNLGSMANAFDGLDLNPTADEPAKETVQVVEGDSAPSDAE